MTRARCALWPLWKGQRVLEARGNKVCYGSSCNNENWTLVFHVLDKMILPLGIRIRSTPARRALLPTRPPPARDEEQNCDLFQEFGCSCQPLWPPFKPRYLSSKRRKGRPEGPGRGAPGSPPWHSVWCSEDSGSQSCRQAVFICGVLGIFGVLPALPPLLTHLPFLVWFYFEDNEI